MSIICCPNARQIDLGCHTYCSLHYLDYYREYLNNLVHCLMISINSLNYQINFGCPNCTANSFCISPFILYGIIDNRKKTLPDSNEIYILSLYQYAIRYCDLYLSGIPTKFDICNLCGKLEIDNHLFKNCCCDTNFKAEFECFEQLYFKYKSLLLSSYIDVSRGDFYEENVEGVVITEESIQRGMMELEIVSENVIE